MNGKKKERKPSSSEAARFLGIGMQIAATMILGVVAGQLLDRYTGQDFTFTLIFSSLAVIVAIYQLIKPFLGNKK